MKKEYDYKNNSKVMNEHRFCQEGVPCRNYKSNTEMQELRMNEILEPKIKEYNQDNRTVLFQFQTKEWQRNPRGEIHGGIISSMFDTALGLTAYYMSEKKDVTTAELSMSFIRPLEFKDELIVHSEVQHLGRTLVRVTGKGYSKKTKKLLAMSHGTFMILS